MPAFLLLAISSLVSCSICNVCLLFLLTMTGASTSMTAKLAVTTTTMTMHPPSCDLSSILKRRAEMKMWNNNAKTLHLYCNGRSEPLKIETTNRISQRIVNNILIIVLKEVMRYASVKEVEANGNTSSDATPDVANTSSALARLACLYKYCDSDSTAILHNSETPNNQRNQPSDSSACMTNNPAFQSMVNLEVGVATGFQFDKWKKNVTEMGRLSDIEGRYGWFVPKSLEKDWKYLQSWKVLRSSKFRKYFNDRSSYCTDADVQAKRCAIVRGRGCDKHVSNSTCAYLIASFVEDNQRSDGGSPGEGEEAGLRGESGSRAGRAAGPAVHDHSHRQNDLLNCQLLTSSLPVNVAYVRRSVYLNTLSNRLGANQTVFFFAWDLDIVHFLYKLVRVDTSTVYYDSPRSHSSRSGDYMGSSSTSSSMAANGTASDKCDRLLHEINSENSNPKRHQLNKFVWPLLRVRALPAFQLIRNFSLSREEYRRLSDMAVEEAERRKIDLLREVDADLAYTVACDWLRSTPEVWTKWFQNVSKKDRLLLVGMFPHYLDRPGGRIPLQLGIEAAARMGIKHVNDDSRLLPDVELDLLVKDTKCLTATAVKEFINIYVEESRRTKIAGIIGPGCSETAAGIKDVTKQLDYILISYGSEGETLTLKDKLDKKVTNFYRLVPSAQSLPYAYLKIFKKWNWTQVAIITMQDVEHKSFQDNFISALKADPIRQNGAPRFTLTEASDAQIFKIFGNKSKEVVKEKYSINDKKLKIIVGIDFFDHVARRLLCLAYRKEMTMKDGYQWFLPGWYPNDWWNTTKYTDDFVYSEAEGKRRRKLKDANEEACTEEEMLKAIDGYMFLDYNTTQFQRSTDDTVTVSNKTRREWWEEYNATNHATVYGQYAYDAVWLFAEALDKMNSSDRNELRTQRVYEEFHALLNFTNFTGVSGQIDWFNRTRDRDDVTIDVYQFIVKTKLTSAIHGGGGGSYNISQTPHESSSSTTDADSTFEPILSPDVDVGIRRILKIAPDKSTTQDKVKSVDSPSKDSGFDDSVPTAMEDRVDWILWDVNNGTGLAQVMWRHGKDTAPEDGVNELGTTSPSCRGLEPLMTLFKIEDCGTAVLVANCLGFGALLIVLAFGYLTYRQKAKVYWEREARLKELLDQGNDEWEVPRANVVINRQIGEGAFGIVNGGDAQFEVDGPWVPVAVKQLKPHAEDLEKISFLSEADIMKTFNHPNVIKLFGVVTRGEPLMNIMEFMLYGDLKNYLLCRRNLVDKTALGSGGGNDGGDGNNDGGCVASEEVNAPRLTQMSLDVARGLEYLNKVGFVHRDISGRNCLVAGDKTIKIGDFGMARRLYDHDYYRFTNQCMLPVRWMSPESLSDGLFSFASDVWSFGVLVYEIVTFGSFPYQGLTNSQVMECVKAGKTLPVPDKLIPKARALLQNCWQKDPTHRPEISEIVQLLEDNSCMITPSLDPPAASVQMEGSLEPVAPQKLKAHREKAFQQQTKGDDKTICTVRPEETVPHQAAALFGMEHVARNQELLPMGAASSCDWKDWTLNDDLFGDASTAVPPERMPLTASSTSRTLGGGSSTSSGSRDHCNNARGGGGGGGGGGNFSQRSGGGTNSSTSRFPPL